MIYYTNISDLRGTCGHRHTTIPSAVACLKKDQRACRKQGGYSGRVTVAMEATRRLLTESEADAYYLAMDGAL